MELLLGSADSVLESAGSSTDPAKNQCVGTGLKNRKKTIDPYLEIESREILVSRRNLLHRYNFVSILCWK